MAVQWKCTLFWDGKVWRWRATAENYLGLSGTAEDEDTAEALCRAACLRAVLERGNQTGTSRQFIVEVSDDSGDSVERS